MGELFSKYEIEKGDWPALAFRLAAEHEPTVARTLKGGPRKTKPTKWTSARKLQLWVDVQLRGKPIKSAVYQAVRSGRYPPGINLDARRVAEARKDPLVQGFERARAHMGAAKFAEAMEGVDFAKIADDMDRFEKLKRDAGVDTLPMGKTLLGG